MILYTQYGAIQGTVDEILEYINKQNKPIQTNGTNFYEKDGTCESEIKGDEKNNGKY